MSSIIDPALDFFQGILFRLFPKFCRDCGWPLETSMERRQGVCLGDMGGN